MFNLSTQQLSFWQLWQQLLLRSSQQQLLIIIEVFCFNALEREEYTSLEWGFLKIILTKRQVQD